MCLICIEFQRQRMTIAEARRAHGEMPTSPEHSKEIEEMLDEAEVKELIPFLFGRNGPEGD